MTDISIQFHALPSEINDLASDLICDPNLFMTEVIKSPTQFVLWPPQDRELKESDNRRALIFTLDKPTLSASSLYQIRMLNPDALVLEIGELSPRGLSESWLSARTDNKIAVQRWQRAAKALKAATLTGAEAVNPNNGASAPMRGHRFTKAAQKSFAEGLAMLPAAGNSIVRLPQPS